ncbi:hypothetical protein [Streptomyces sp. NPDC000878]
MLDKLSLGGQLGALGEPPTVDCLAQLVGDLPEDRTIARGVEITEQTRGTGVNSRGLLFRHLEE